MKEQGSVAVKDLLIRSKDAVVKGAEILKGGGAVPAAGGVILHMAGELPCQGGIHKEAAAQHYGRGKLCVVFVLAQGIHLFIIIFDTEDIPVIDDGKRAFVKCLPKSRQVDLSAVALRLCPGVDNELRKGIALIYLQYGAELLLRLHADTGLDGDPSSGPGIDPVQEAVQGFRILKHGGAFSVGGHGL